MAMGGGRERERQRQREKSIYGYVPGPSIATYILGTKKIRYELRFPARFEKNVRL